MDTPGFPLFVLAMGFIPMLLGTPFPSQQSIGFVDNTGIFKPQKGLISYSDEQEAKQALLNDEIQAYFVIPQDYVEEGGIEIYTNTKGKWVNKERIEEFLVQGLVEGKVPKKVEDRIKDPLKSKTYRLNEEGEKEEDSPLKSLVPFFFALFLLMAILFTSGFLLEGIVEEKQNRIVEILLSSLSPSQLMRGKILGLVGIGLTQVLVWFLVGGMLLVYSLPALLPQLGITLPAFLGIFLTGIIYFLLGYLLFSSIFAGIGTISNSVKEGQQIASFVWFPLLFSLIFGQYLLRDPHSLIAQILSYFPLTSPAVMLMRMGTTQVPLYQILLSLTILLISIFIVLKISSKVFRVGLLMYGKRPNLREIIRWWKAAE